MLVVVVVVEEGVIVDGVSNDEPGVLVVVSSPVGAWLLGWVVQALAINAMMIVVKTATLFGRPELGHRDRVVFG